MKIAVAMSGGIDSTVAAIMLKEQGHEIIGLTAKILLCADMDGAEPRFDVCCSPESIMDAKNIAKQYDFPHVVVNVEDDFENKIIKPFCEEYLKGRTPSPCLVCNSEIKFRKLIDFAHSMGYEKLATGHYAKINQTEDERFYVTAGIDPDKDQSYFLSTLSQDVLSNTLFPLGSLHKSEIREMAQKMNLEVANKPESQEICFIFDNDYAGYIERKTGVVPASGDIVNREGEVLGKHKGIHRYTVGQRRGLGISAPFPLYVVEVDHVNNRVIVGYKDELNTNGLIARKINYQKVSSLDGQQVYIKTRSTQTAFLANTTMEGESILVKFNEPQKGISPGQAVVFYDEEKNVLAGGWIESSF